MRNEPYCKLDIRLFGKFLKFNPYHAIIYNVLQFPWFQLPRIIFPNSCSMFGIGFDEYSGNYIDYFSELKGYKIEGKLHVCLVACTQLLNEDA